MPRGLALPTSARNSGPGTLQGVSETQSGRVALNLPGSRAKVELDGVLGIVVRTYVNGQRSKPSKGGWDIPVSRGGTAKLRVRGWLPGFQTFYWDDKPVYKLGAHVGLPERIVMFAPVIVLFSSVFAAPIALGLFFMNIPVVKNTHMPRPLRIALPIVNSVAVFLAVVALVYMVRPSGDA